MNLDKTKLDDFIYDKSWDKMDQEAEFLMVPEEGDLERSSDDKSDLENFNLFIKRMEKQRRMFSWKSVRPWLFISGQLLPILLALYAIHGYQNDLESLRTDAQHHKNLITHLKSHVHAIQFAYNLRDPVMISSYLVRDYSTLELHELYQDVSSTLRDHARALRPFNSRRFPATESYVITGKAGVVQLLQIGNTKENIPVLGQLWFRLRPRRCELLPRVSGIHYEVFIMLANGSTYEFKNTNRPFDCSALQAKHGKTVEPETEMIKEISTYFKRLVPELDTGIGEEKDLNQHTDVAPYTPWKMPFSDSIEACVNWIQKKYGAFTTWIISTWENWKRKGD